ncbi:hypothetical protein KW795_01850 [Candidatus Microgenomates bacterium]|nr:hypothetical protein [Candidatus Microgenomates bacterium]
MKDDIWTITTNPTDIKLWAQAHNGKPELLDDIEAGSDEFILRLDFPGKKDNIFLGQTPLETKIDWDKFFELMKGKNLAFEYIKDYEGESPDYAYRFIKKDAINTKAL